MITTITPAINLDTDIHIENELLEMYDTNKLDAKSLLIIGQMAIRTSSEQLQTSHVSSQLNALKESYDKLVSEVKNDAHTQVATARADMAQQKLFYEQLIKNNENHLVDIKKQYERLEEASRTQAEVLAQSLLNERDCQIAVLQEKIRGFVKQEEQLNLMVKTAEDQANTMKDEFIKNIRDDEINKLKAEIAALKGSNFSKGIVGETIVQNILKSAFADHQVLDKSSSATESDVHLVNPKTQQFIAIEVKNKATITLNDVDKSLRDIKSLRDKYGQLFLGYVFVSLNTMNIPKKGTSFEISNDTPVVWYGANPDNLQSTLPTFINIIFNIVNNINKEQKDENSLKQEQIAVMVNDAIHKVEANNKIVANIINNINTLQENNILLLQQLNGFLAENGIERTSTVEFICPSCKRKFSRKGDLTNHSKKCKVALSV
jgi:hypothetical protein